MKGNYRTVDNIDSNLLKEPRQTEITGNEPIIFEKNDYEFKLTPLYEYEISGLIVREKDYSFFTLDKEDSGFPIDICIIWGENVDSKNFKSRDIYFSQDSRFCYWRYKEEGSFNNNEISNNHIISNNKEIEKKIKSFLPGDQVKLKGKLVDVKAKIIGEGDEYDPKKFSMNTSISREDTGAGACEIIYVEDVEVYSKANPVIRILNTFSFYGLGLIFFLGFIKFIFFKPSLKN